MKQLLMALLIGLMLTSCEFGKAEHYDPMQDKSVKGFHIQYINGWSDVLASKDGPMYFIDQNSYTGEMNTLFSVVETDESKLTPGYIRFGENNIPSYIEINNTRLYVTNVNNETISFILLYTVDGVEYVYTVSDYAHDLNLSSGDTRGFVADNYVALHNSIAIGQLVTGAVGIGAGVLMIAGGVATVNPLIILSGALGLASGIRTIGSGYESITSDPYYKVIESDEYKEIKENILFELGQKSFEKIDEKYFKNFMKDHPTLDKVGWGTFLAELSLDVLNRLLENSDDVELLMAYDDYMVITGRSENVLSTVATLWAYVSPTEYLPNGAQSEIEYGINLCAAGSHSPLSKHEVIGGPGAVFKHTFKGLQPNTEYSYYTYFYDKINNVVLYGPLNNFKTSNEEAYIEDVKVLETYYEDDEINFIIQADASYSYTEENAPRTWGVQVYHKDESLGYVTYDGNGNKSKKIRLRFAKSALKLNPYEYIAEVEDLSLTTYIIYQDSSMHNSKDYYPVDGLIYNHKPSMTIKNLQVGSTIPISEGNWDTKTFYSHKLDVKGAFWMDYIYKYYIGNWTNPGEKGHYSTSADEIKPFDNADVRYSSKNQPHTNYSYYGAVVNGMTVRSTNQIVYHFNGGSVNINLEGSSTTRAISNDSNEEGNYPSVGDSDYVIPKVTKIKLSDTHNSKYRVIEEIKCKNGIVIEVLE